MRTAVPVVHELEFQISHRRRLGSRWVSGFEVYDNVRGHYVRDVRARSGTDARGGTLYDGQDAAKHPGQYKNLDTWERFAERCQDLLFDLRGATPAP